MDNEIGIGYFEKLERVGICLAAVNAMTCMTRKS